MRLAAGTCGMLVLLIVTLPKLGAGDKKDPGQETKEDETKNEDKGKKGKKEPEAKLNYSQTITARLKRLDSNSARDFTIEVPQLDPNKVYQLNIWKLNEMNRIMRIPLNQPVLRAQQLALFNMQVARKESTEVYTMKDLDVRAADSCKVRTLGPPVEFDDKGRQKVFSQKELNALRGTSKLPGYAADFDRLHVGQVITVYFAKAKDPPKREAGAPKKRNPDDDDAKPEAVLIVVVQEAPPR